MNPFFIINPNSSTVRKRGSVLARLARDRDIAAVQSREPAELGDIFAAAAQRGADWFAIEGGDGTVHAAMTAYMAARDKFKRPPAFTLVPGGMTNQVARHIGAGKPVAKRLAAIISGDRPEIVSKPMLQVDIDQAQYFGFLFSTGAIPMATQYYFDHLHVQGKGGAGAVMRMIARGIGGRARSRARLYHATPLGLRITGNKAETHLRENHLTTVVTTLPGLMLGLDPFWGEGDDPLRLTYVRDGAGHLIRNLASLWLGRKQASRSVDGLESWNAVVIKYDYQGPVVLDGEVLERDEEAAIYVRATEPLTFWR